MAPTTAREVLLDLPPPHLEEEGEAQAKLAVDGLKIGNHKTTLLTSGHTRKFVEMDRENFILSIYFHKISSAFEFRKLFSVVLLKIVEEVGRGSNETIA